MRNFEAHSDKIRQDMLDEMNVSKIEDLFSSIPKECAIKGLNLDAPLSELEAQRQMHDLSKKNKVDYISFLGAPAVRKFIPSAINAVISRFEFLSAYTPYQPEISQGTLQNMYEFQSYICELTNMDVSNASVYDGATAAAESALMAVRINKIKNVFIDKNVNPNYLEVIKTYLWAQDIKYTIGDIKEPSDDIYACKMYAYPDYFGELRKAPNKTGKELIIALVDPSCLAVVEPPQADIIAGDYQPFGLNLSFGGAYGGFIATKDIYKRQLAGRICGKTVDKEGKTAYVLTLQAREQHIRRSKATGNICSNQALTALNCALYLSLVGKSGISQYANYSHNLAIELSEKLDKLGYKTLNKNFFNTFTILMKQGLKSGEFLAQLKKNGILGGIKCGDDKVIITLTECNTKNDICLFLAALENFC